MEGRRRERERMGRIDEGKRERKKKKERKENKNKNLNFPEVISLNIFVYIVTNIYYIVSLKIVTQWDECIHL